MTRKESAWEKTSNQEYVSNTNRTYALSPEGAWVCKEDYGIEDVHGWDIDHWDGDTSNNDPENLRAMQWENNRSKGNSNECYIRKVYAVIQEDGFVNKRKDKKMCLTDKPNKDI